MILHYMLIDYCSNCPNHPYPPILHWPSMYVSHKTHPCILINYLECKALPFRSFIMIPLSTLELHVDMEFLKN